MDGKQWTVDGKRKWLPHTAALHAYAATGAAILVSLPSTDHRPPSTYLATTIPPTTRAMLKAWAAVGASPRKTQAKRPLQIGRV